MPDRFVAYWKEICRSEEMHCSPQYQHQKTLHILDDECELDMLSRAPAQWQQRADAAFIAIPLQILGRTDEAREALARLHEMMKKKKHAENEESQRFLHEAEALIEGPP